MKIHTRQTLAYSLLACSLMIALPLRSQSTDPTTKPASDAAAATPNKNVPVETTSGAKPPASSDEAITLSPFEVSTERDNGYYAANTMSGTRIASKVQDLGASISVVTKQQLIDTASVDINDIFRYESNTEGTFDFTAQNTASPTTDSIQSSPYTSNRIRGISTPNIAIDNFGHTARIPLDTYNIGSIEISRGPNSTLFGLGSPSGTVNSNQNQALTTRNVTEIGASVDSYGGVRGIFDLNRVIWKNKIALRIDGENKHMAFEQKPSYDDTQRIFGTLTIQPFKDTTIRLSVESYREKRQTPNSLTPRDGVTEWLQNGKPTWNPQTSTFTRSDGTTGVVHVGSGSTAELTVFPLGLYVNSTTYTRPSMFIAGGQVQLWEVNRLATTNNPNAGTTSDVRLISSGSAIMRGVVNGGNLYNVPGVNNKAIYDWTEINADSTNWNQDKAGIYEAVIEQRIVDNLYFRAGWHLEDSDSYNRNITNPPVLTIDVNQNLLDGRANPFFLRPYILNIEPTIFRSPEYNDNLQAELTYDLDLTKYKGFWHWLGNHRMLGYYESRRITDGTFRSREAIIDPNHVWETAGALNYTNGPALNRPSYRYYVGPTGAIGYVDGYQPPKSGVAGNFNLNYYNGATNQWVSDPSTFGTAPYITGQTRQEITSRGVVDQSMFFDDRLVVSAGLRKDFTRSRNSNGAVVNGNTGFYDIGPISTYGAWTGATGFTRMVSVVAKPFHWIGLTYNRSSSFLPQPPAVDLSGNVLPNTYAHNQEYGFFMNLLDDKLVFSVKIYKTTNINDRNPDTTLGSRVARIENGASDNFSLEHFAETVAANRGLVAGTAPYVAAVTSLTQFSPGFINASNAANAGAALRGTNDLQAKGAEVELTYNPTYNWNFKFAGAQTKTINLSLENDIEGYLASRLAYWQTVKDDQGNLWWTSTALSSQSAQNFYTVSVAAPLKIDQALLGKPNPQNKEYTWRAITNYRFTNGFLKNVSVGGSLAWNDKSVIGFLGATADSDGIVRSLDVNRPVYDPSRYSADFWTSYTAKIWRTTMKVQLNLKNAFENGGLRATAVNPDGTVYNWRIIYPRQWVLNTTFDF